MSHPSRVRGLKSWCWPIFSMATLVAPLAGAWIEMKMGSPSQWSVPQSHPSRVRGLKSNRFDDGFYGVKVAPLAGAWIEIPTWTSAGIRTLVAPLAGAWIEMKELQEHFGAKSGRTPRGCVD